MLIHQHLKMQSPVYQKELMVVARFQTVLYHNFNVDINTHVFASALNRIVHLATNDRLIRQQS